MRSAMFSLLAGAAAAVALANPATAAVTVTDTSGTPLINQIYGIDGTSTTVYGSSPNNDGVANVTFTGDTTIHVGAGFAQINDATPDTPDFYSLIINPDQDFDAFKWSVMLTEQKGTVEVFYLLASSGLDANLFSSYTDSAGTYDAGKNNLNKLLSGGVFDGFMIRSSTPISFFEIKQMSYNPGGSAVPEPGTWAMMLLGFGAIGFGMRRRRSTGAVMQIA